MKAVRTATYYRVEYKLEGFWDGDRKFQFRLKAGKAGYEVDFEELGTCTIITFSWRIT